MRLWGGAELHDLVYDELAHIEQGYGHGGTEDTEDDAEQCLFGTALPDELEKGRKVAQGAYLFFEGRLFGSYGWLWFFHALNLQIFARPMAGAGLGFLYFEAITTFVCRTKAVFFWLAA